MHSKHLVNMKDAMAKCCGAVEHQIAIHVASPLEKPRVSVPCSKKTLMPSAKKKREKQRKARKAKKQRKAEKREKQKSKKAKKSKGSKKAKKQRKARKAKKGIEAKKQRSTAGGNRVGRKKSKKKSLN